MIDRLGNAQREIDESIDTLNFTKQRLRNLAGEIQQDFDVACSAEEKAPTTTSESKFVEPGFFEPPFMEIIHGDRVIKLCSHTKWTYKTIKRQSTERGNFDAYQITIESHPDRPAFDGGRGHASFKSEEGVDWLCCNNAYKTIVLEFKDPFVKLPELFRKKEEDYVCSYNFRIGYYMCDASENAHVASPKVLRMELIDPMYGHDDDGVDVFLNPYPIFNKKITKIILNE
jgi:hypothetical protein